MTDMKVPTATPAPISDPFTRDDRAFSVERRGIDPVPEMQRHGSARELFWVWMGPNITFIYVTLGAAIVGLGVSFWTAICLVVVGNLFLVLVGLGAIAGPRAGTGTLIVSRSAFGIRGNNVPAFLSWLTIVGWEAVNLVLATFALYQLSIKLGIAAGTTNKLLCLFATMVATFGVAIWGHQTIVVLQRVLSWILGLGTLIAAIYILPKVNFSSRATPVTHNHVGLFLLGLLVIAASPFGWVNYPADYARYLPKETKPALVAFWTTLGGLIPALLISVVGVAAATSIDMSNPVAGIEKLVPSWLGTTYLAVIVGGTITNNFLNTYSSGLGLQAMGIRIPRTRSVIFDALIGGSMAAYAVFVHDFSNTFITFLSLMVLWVAPWCGIYLVDMAVRRAKYSSEHLLASGPGPYWYKGGWNPAALAAFALGIGAAMLFSNNPYFQGPLVSLVGGGDLSIFAGIAVSAAVYYVSTRYRATSSPAIATDSFILAET